LGITVVALLLSSIDVGPYGVRDFFAIISLAGVLAIYTPIALGFSVRSWFAA
jgi:hypothetical protein